MKKTKNKNEKEDEELREDMTNLSERMKTHRQNN